MKGSTWARAVCGLRHITQPSTAAASPSEKVLMTESPSIYLVLDRDGQRAVRAVRPVREIDREVYHGQSRRFPCGLGVVGECRDRYGDGVVRVSEFDSPAGRAGKIQVGQPIEQVIGRPVEIEHFGERDRRLRAIGGCFENR